MAGTRFQVKTYGATIVQRKLLGLAAAAGDCSPAWPAVTEVAARAYENAFQKEGPGWQPLQDSTTRSRIRDGFPPGPILTKSGTFRRSVTVDPKFSGTSDTLEIMTDVEYGKFHQTGRKATARLLADGTTVNSGYMPARPLKVSRYYRKLMASEIRQYLMEGYNGA